MPSLGWQVQLTVMPAALDSPTSPSLPSQHPQGQMGSPGVTQELSSVPFEVLGFGI